MPSAIATGYRKGIATIVDANVITLLTAFILFVLATAGVKGFAFTLGVGTIVSLFTAVLFTQAILGSFGRSKILNSPRALGARDNYHHWNFDFTGASKWFFSISGVILSIGAISFATQQLNLGIDFESGTRITASLDQAASTDEVRTAISDAGIPGAGNAEIQAVDNPELGDNVYEIKGDFSGDDAKIQSALNSEFGLVKNGFSNTTVGPTFGEQIARKALVAIIFSLLVISAYMALRFEAKYAIPVLIALVHDILITGGVYSLVGREVTSGTVAAFLTILGYSMYDTVIVFDRVRENVPRMPRAAFSQIVNRSMSEVLTRSLITGLATVFLLGVLLIFGGETLKDFAFAMMIGVASGAYSSIFIASPVLTEWKEREPAYRNRRARIKEAMGFVPTFPEDNVVAKIDEVERHTPEGEEAARQRRPKGRRQRQEEAQKLQRQAQAEAATATAVETEEPQVPPADGTDGAPEPAATELPPVEEPAATEPAEPGGRETPAQRAARQQRERRGGKRRRKHGRPR